MKPTILVTGCHGQLGKELQILATLPTNYNFFFTNRTHLDITNENAIADYFKNNHFDFVVNTAAYTAVDKAETDKENAYAANALAPYYLAKYSGNAKLIHICTDYVFDGTKQIPYTETDTTNPINYYGQTKLIGEQKLLAEKPDSIIIRTSWVYSFFGTNFVKTMLRLMAEKERISVVADQIGSPTYAASLAAAIMHIIAQFVNGKKANGIFNYSNEGAISWYEFAKEIARLSNSTCNVNPIDSNAYPTAAKRSKYSVLDKTKIKKEFDLNIDDWKVDLEKCIKLLKK